MAKNDTQNAPALDTESAPRRTDPYESDFMGVVRTNDPLLIERGQNVELYRDLKRDGKVHSGLRKFAGAIVGREWTIDPIKDGEKSSAETVTKILKAINFDQVCRDLLDAEMMGYSVGEIIWTVSDSMIVPKRIIKRRQRRFIYVDPGENKGPELRLLTSANMLTGVELPEKKFIVHRCNPEDDNPYGTGLGLQLYWPVFFKRKGIIAWNKLNDRFGAPTPWGRYPRNASPKEKATLFDALKAISNDGVVMTPEGMQLDLLESKLTGSITTQQALCQYMDDWIAEVILGQETRDAGGRTGAAANERSTVRLDLARAASDLLSDTLNQSLIAWICEYNGLAPCRVYRDMKEEKDKKDESETDKNVAEMGFELDEDAVRAKYGDGWHKKAAPAPSKVGGDNEDPNLPAEDPKVDNEETEGEGKPAPSKATASFAEQAAAGGTADAIDALVDDALDGWEPALNPMVEPIVKLMQDAAAKGETAAELLARLPDVLGEMDTAALAGLLAKTTAAGRLAGNAGISADL
jgi:phage gp29-like protein